MIVQSELDKIKQSLDKIVGQRIRLTSSKGRKRSVIRLGVIEKTYPSIFVVKLENQTNSQIGCRRISYSYTDVLTKSVELALCAKAE